MSSESHENLLNYEGYYLKLKDNHFVIDTDINRITNTKIPYKANT